MLFSHPPSEARQAASAVTLSGGSDAKNLRKAFEARAGLDEVRSLIWKARPAGKTSGSRETIGRSVR